MPKKYPPLSLREFREILETFNIVRERTKGGHVILVIEIEGKERTIVYQTHIDPVPLEVLKNTIQDLEVSVREFYSRSKSAAKKKNVRYRKKAELDEA